MSPGEQPGDERDGDEDEPAEEARKEAEHQHPRGAGPPALLVLAIDAPYQALRSMVQRADEAGAPRTERPTRAALEAAAGRRLPDVIAPGLRILYCGINPSLYSAAVGHHFARPGNRFWPALHRAGLTPVRLRASEDRRLLELGQGLTNLVARATARAEEVSAAELRRGAATLRRKVARYRPAAVAFLGLGAYRHAFEVADARVGPRRERWAGALVWVLPNPSGLNAHYRLDDLARLFAELRSFLPVA